MLGTRIKDLYFEWLLHKLEVSTSIDCDFVQHKIKIYCLNKSHQGGNIVARSSKGAKGLQQDCNGVWGQPKCFALMQKFNVS